MCCLMVNKMMKTKHSLANNGTLEYFNPFTFAYFLVYITLAYLHMHTIHLAIT